MLYQITKAASNENFQQKQQNRIVYVNKNENNDVIIILTFHTTIYKTFGKKLPSALERTITVRKLKKCNSRKEIQEKYFILRNAISLNEWKRSN